MLTIDRTEEWIWFAVAALMLIDAIGYTVGAIGPIRQAVTSPDPYWQKRLLLNLMLANQGMYLAAAVAITGAFMRAHQQRGASTLFGLTLATCVYTIVTVPLFTPRDSMHIIPRAIAAVLIITGFVL